MEVTDLAEQLTGRENKPVDTTIVSSKTDETTEENLADRHQGPEITLPYFKRLNHLASFLSTLQLTIRPRQTTTITALTIVTSIQTITKTNTFFIQRCTPSPFPFSQCNQ